MTLTTTPHSTQQPMAVWNHRLNNDPEGPTFINNTALLSSDSGFYIRTSRSHSGHTVYLAPEWGSVTAGMGTAAVAGGDGFALRGGDTPLLPAHIQRLTISAEHDRGDLRVATHAA